MTVDISSIMSSRPIAKHKYRRYGIEIEVEGCRDTNALGEAVSEYWRTIGDGSLRDNGVELVSTPRTLTGHKAPLKLAYKHMARTGAKGSARTGIHVHCDMSAENMDTVLKAVTTYCLMEPVLFRIAGEDREQNVYCVPWYSAPQEAEAFSHSVSRGSPNSTRSSLEVTSCKYSALYVAPLVSFGTIELRMAPTFETPEEVVKFLIVINRFLNYAAKHATPTSILEHYTAQGADAWLDIVLGRDRARAIMAGGPPLSQLEISRDTLYPANIVAAAGLARADVTPDGWRASEIDVAPGHFPRGRDTTETTADEMPSDIIRAARARQTSQRGPRENGARHINDALSRLTEREAREHGTDLLGNSIPDSGGSGPVAVPPPPTRDRQASMRMGEHVADGPGTRRTPRPMTTPQRRSHDALVAEFRRRST